MGLGREDLEMDVFYGCLFGFLIGKVENSFDSFISELGRKAAARPDVSRLVISNSVMIP